MNTTFEATAVDESIGGVGLHTKFSVALVPGQPVSIVYRDVEMTARVASIFPDSKGGCRLALSWADSSDAATSDAAESLPFFQFRGVTMICEIVGQPPQSDEDPHAPRQIRLWDGTSFDVQAKQIVHRTQIARRTEILTMGPASYLLTQLYELEPSAKPEAAVEEILNFEFGDRRVV